MNKYKKTKIPTIPILKKNCWSCRGLEEGEVRSGHRHDKDHPTYRNFIKFGENAGFDEKQLEFMFEFLYPENI